jgi:hypothetical protein
MAPQASKKCGFLPLDYQRIGSWTSNGINIGTGSWHRSCLLQAALSFTLIIRRWKMKRFCGYFFVSGLMLGSLLLQYDSALALDSTMAHHDKGSGTTSPSGCVSDMTDPTQLSTTLPQTFRLCAFNSGATDWSAEIRKDSYPYALVTGCSMAKVKVAIQNSFSCSVITPGSYRGLFTYWIGTTQKGHTDRKFVR